MPTFDAIIRSATIVAGGRVAPGDIAITDGRIADAGPELAGAAREEIDAAGLHLFPAVIDAHVHFNEPGREGWEGWATGSRALAAGGGAVAIDMPLNSTPPVLDAAAFDAKAAAAAASSVTDFALWGGLTPDNVDRLDDLAERGVVGFKAFMSGSGIEDFRAADDDALFRGMQAAARLGLPVAVHAENDAIAGGGARRAIAAGRTGWADWVASRPVVAETEAIARAIHLAGAAGCSLHVVHVSSGAGAALIADARARGREVTGETCPHYLTLTDADLAVLGAVAKCAPPLRDAAERAALWRALAGGALQIVGSDHSPAPADMKTGDDAFAIWGGIAGVQSTLPLLLTEGVHAGEIPLELAAAATSERVAARFRLPGKGGIAPGMDADLALVDLGASWTLERGDLLDRHRLSPYIGRAFRGRPVRTLVRGRTVWQDGAAVPGAWGKLVVPSRAD